MTLKSVSPNQGVMGQALPVQIKGSGFAATTRLSMSLDAGNAKAIIGSIDTPGLAHGVTVVGDTAFVTDNMKGLQVIDVSNPATPVLIGSLDTPGNAYDISYDVSVVGHTALVADYCKGVRVIDVSDLAAPLLLATVDTPNCANAVSAVGDKALVGTGNGLLVMDITTPAAPVILGSVNTPGGVDGLAVMGDKAVVVTGYGLRVIDVSKPAAPVVIGSVDTPGGARGLTVVGDKAFVADGDDGLQVIDLSTPAEPAIIGAVDTPGIASAVSVVGDRAVVADGYHGGLQVVDVSNPAKPVVIGSVDTPGEAYDVVMVGDTALVADYNQGLQVIDVSNPTPQGIIGAIALPEGGGNVTVVGDTAYVANGNDGLQVIDVKDPAKPVAIGTVDIPGEAHSVTVVGDTAYVATGLLSGNGDPGVGGLQVIDVSNPAAPIIVGAVDTGYITNVAVSGDMAYVVNSSKGLQVIDASNPTAPVIVGSVSTPGSASNVFVVGNMAYVADGNHGLQVIDASVPSAPVIVGSVAIPGGGGGIDVSVVGNTALVLNGYTSLHVVDVSNPASPAIIGSVNTPEYTSAVTVVGDMAYVAAAFNGLEVINVSNPAAPVVVGSVDTSGFAAAVSVVDHTAYVRDWEGLTIVPVPQEVQPLTVVDASTLSLTLPPPQTPGNYTLRVFNSAGDGAGVAGAVNFTTLNLAALDPNALFLQTVSGETPPATVATGQGLDLQLLYKDPSGTPFNLSNLPDFPVEWFSSHPGVLKVSPLGHLTAQAPGSAVITAQTPAGKQWVDITVEGVPVPANAGNLIIIAGRKYENETLAGYFSTMANRVYQTLHARGFSHDDIYYLNSYSSQFLEDEPATSIVDRLVGVTEKNLAPEISAAITTWAVSQENSGPLYLYLVGHGAPDQAVITVAPSALLVGAQINAALNSFETATGRAVIVIVESCYSGQWAKALKKSGRVVITSASATQAENLPLDNTISFSRYLFDALAQGKSVAKAFALATEQTQGLSYAVNQAPQLESDQDLSSTYVVGKFASQGLTPIFTGYTGKSEVIQATTGQTLPLTASLNMPYSDGFTVWAEITPPVDPGQVVAEGDTPVVEAYKVALTYTGSADPEAYFGGDKLFEGSVGLFSQPGVYDLAYFAKNLSGQIMTSDHVAVSVQPGTPSGLNASLSLAGGGALPEELAVDQSIIMQATFGTQGQQAAVQWFSSNPGVLTVASDGVVSVLAPGEATITAIYPGGSVSHHVTVPGNTTVKKGYGNLVLLAGISDNEQGGGGLSQTFATIAKTTYTTFYNRGLGHDDMAYFSPYGSQTLPGVSENIVDNAFSATDSTIAAKVTEAITGWAAGQENSGPLYVQLVGHGASTYFLGSTQGNLPISDLDQALDGFQKSTGRSVVVMAEACYSGDWLATLQGENRVVITNTDSTPVWLLTNATSSFTGYLMAELSKGQSLQVAFGAATQSIQKTFAGQQPQNQVAAAALWASPLVGSYASASGSFFTDYTGKGGGVAVKQGDELILSATVTVLAPEGVTVQARIIPPPPVTPPDTALTPTYKALIVPLTLENTSGDTATFSGSATLSLPPGPSQVNYILTNEQGEEFVSDPVTMTVGGETTPSLTLAIVNGWNLLSSAIGFQADSVLNDKGSFTSVWKWKNGDSANWAVYLPGEEDGGAAYAVAKGFGQLAAIAPGEGFWVNAEGPALLTISGMPEIGGGLTLGSGWNLVGLKSAQAVTAADVIAGTAGIVSLWKWDNNTWSVRLPEDEDGGQAYANDKGFGLLMTINPGEGVWVNAAKALTMP